MNNEYRYNNKLTVGKAKRFDVDFIVRDAKRDVPIVFEIDVWTNLDDELNWRSFRMNKTSLDKKWDIDTPITVMDNIVVPNVHEKASALIIPNVEGEFYCTFRGRLRYVDEPNNLTDWFWYDYDQGDGVDISLHVQKEEDEDSDDYFPPK